jgi:hypothetical protein
MSNFILLGVNNYPFSFALWIRPRSIIGGILIRLYSKMNGNQRWCTDLLGLSSNGKIVATSWQNTITEVVGPNIIHGVWTHVASTYSISNGVQLYVNGTLKGSIGLSKYNAPEQINFLTLGFPFAGAPCSSISIPSNSYEGDIDEFRVYSRELTAGDVSFLAR